MSRLRIRDAGNVLRTAVRIRIRDASNTLRTVQRIRIRDASNVLRTVFQYFTAFATPNNVTGGYYGTPGTQNITSSACLAVVTGGVGPFTYSWAQVGSSSYSWTINSPSNASTTFTAASVGIGATAEAVFRCTVTDTGSGLTVDTQDIPAEVTNFS